MEIYKSVRREVIISSTIIVMGLLLGFTTLYAQAGKQQSPSMKELKSWRVSIAHTPRPKSGCFTAEYPKLEWREVTCTKAPVHPYRPARGSHSYLIGNGNDVTAEIPSGHISEAIGSFDSVTGVANEYGINPNNQVFSPNIFSLQLNSNFFAHTPSCNGVNNCLGWAQFVYSNSAGQAFIQYWLIGYGPSCPTSGGPAGTGWLSDGSGDCYGNSNAVTITGSPPLNISGLSQLSITGQAVAGGNDTFIMYVGSTARATTSLDTVVRLANYWQTAEFNIFGDGNSSEATFNYNSSSVATLRVKTTVNYGGASAPTCLATGYTAETNNLFFDGYYTSSSPTAVVFTESSANNGYSACQSAASTGDTHLTTFTGLQYDFQATGDFVLTEADSDFIVQTRQAWPVIDPRWKNTSINKAVGIQMGPTRIALYVEPTRLIINDKPYAMSNDQSHLVINNIQITRKNNEYVITSSKGNSVRATLYNNGMNTWMDVTVSLNRSMKQVRGLLGTLDGKTEELVTAQGVFLKWPVSFDELYNLYGESWRVQPNQMLLETDSMVTPGIPKQSFYVSNLKPKEAASAIAICKAAGISKPALLDACALDIAVLGDSTPLKAYIHATAPRAVMPRPIQ